MNVVSETVTPLSVGFFWGDSPGSSQAVSIPTERTAPSAMTLIMVVVCREVGECWGDMVVLASGRLTGCCDSELSG